jgi:hypothetical protein
MNIITLKEGMKPAALAADLARKSKLTEKEALARLLAANPHLEKTGSIPAGAAVLVPAELAGEVAAAPAPAPGRQPLLTLVRDLQAALPDLQTALKAAAADAGQQQKEFKEMVAERLSGQQGDVPAAVLRQRIATVDKRTKLLAQEADEQQSQHAKMLKQVGHDLNAFLNLHTVPPVK